MVVSVEEPAGAAISLEPCKGSFAEAFQKSAYETNLPIMIIAVENVFEDGCGN